MLARTAALIVALYATSAAAEAPDPTQVIKLEAVDPCAGDPGCKLARFRAKLAEQRRREYLKLVVDSADKIDKAQTKAKPWRTRYDFEVNFQVISNVALYGVNVAYAPLWWLKTEAFLGKYESNQYTYDANGSGYTDMNATAVGTGVRFLPIKWPLTPYVSVGWAYLNGTISRSIYTYDSGGFGGNDSYSEGDAEAHTLMAGLGAELVVPYFHLALGYQFSHAFYVQARRDDMHDDDLRSAVRQNMNDNHHGVSFQIGCAF